jgi:hypothetical protein
MADDYHVIVTHEGEYGFTLESPQLPGFAFARPTMTEFRRDYRDALAFAGVSGTVFAHRQQRFTSPEGVEYLIRQAENGDQDARMEVVTRLQGLLAGEQRFELLTDAETTAGEVVFVAAAPADRMRAVADQLDGRGDRIILAAAVAENGLWTVRVASGDAAGPQWKTLEERGLTLDTTVADVMKALSAGEARHERLLVNA